METHKKRQWWFTLLYLAGAILLFYFLQKGAQTTRPKQVAYTEFLSEIRAGHLTEVTIGADDITGTFTDEAAKSEGVKSIIATRPPNVTDPSLLQDLETHS